MHRKLQKSQKGDNYYPWSHLQSVNVLLIRIISPFTIVFYCKKNVLTQTANPRRLSHSAWKSVERFEVGWGKIKKSRRNEVSPIIQCCTAVKDFTAVPHFGQGQNFGFGFHLGLKALASAWLRTAAKETAAKRRRSSLCLPTSGHHTMQRLCLMIQHQNNIIAVSLPSTMNPSP